MAGRVNERAMVAEDQRNLAQARKTIRTKNHKDAGDQQIAEKLDDMIGTADLNDPQRYHGS